MERKKLHYSSTDETGESSAENTELVISESEDGSGRKRKYTVSRDPDRFALCDLRKLSRNERLCLIIGAFILAAVVLIFIIVGVAVNSQTSSKSSSGGHEGNGPWVNIRLPSDITPDSYDIMLDVDLTGFVVTGNETITATVSAETRYVILHSNAMTITEFVVSQDGQTLEKTREFPYPDHQFYVVELQSDLKVGEVTIKTSFNYSLGETLDGFYKSSYVDSAGQTHYLAVTQFEATDARKAFPCFDEPGMKATFAISITHDEKYNATSNMPGTRGPVNELEGTVTTTFQRSVKMSTYLVAFVVSEFWCVNGTSGRNDIEVRVCSNREVVDKTDFALKVAIDVLAFYEDYFNISYPLPKQDLFAIPDFAAGAMENWGLITYRETALLYDNNTDPASSKQRVALVIAHELAHQWFGNLVTMAWWDGLWLNEGFASFTEYVGTNSTEPSFMMLDQFIISDLEEALSEDSLNESHPILIDVQDPDEISAVFDSIIYNKGASVIRMLRHLIGAEDFQNGVHRYLMRHKFGNAETYELWEAIQEVVDEDPTVELEVAEMMNTWTNQTGYPVVDVKQNGAKLTLTQTRFFAMKPVNMSTIPPSPYNYLWKIPFNFITDNDQTPQRKLFEKATDEVSLPSGGPTWWKANVGEFGFYIVNYEESNWKKIAKHLKDDADSSILSAVDRAGLLGDAFSLSSAGLLDTTIALDLSLYLDGEREYQPWVAAIDWFSAFGNRLSLTPLYGKYQCFVSQRLQEVVSGFGFDTQVPDHLQNLLRYLVFSSAWKLGHPDVISNATKIFKAWKENGEQFDPNLKGVVYGVGIAYGTVEDWDYLWNWYNRTDDPYEKRLCLVALAESRVPWILSRYLNYSITHVRSQDTLSVITYVSRNVYGRQLTWYFVRNLWSYFFEIYGSGTFSFSRVIRSVTSSFTTELELAEVEQFFLQNPDAGSGTRASRQAIEVIRRNIVWLNTNLDILDSYLQDC